jgi:hypothetical protein
MRKRPCFCAGAGAPVFQSALGALRKKGARNAGLSACPRPHAQSVKAHEIGSTTEKLEDSSVPRAMFEGLLHRPQWTFLHRNAGQQAWRDAA